MKFLGEEVQRRLPKLHGLFLTIIIVLDTKSSGMNLTGVGFHPTFSLEDPTSNYSLCFHRQKKIQKQKKIPNQTHRFQSETRLSETVTSRMKINQNPLFLAKQNVCTPASFAQEHCDDWGNIL